MKTAVADREVVGRDEEVARLRDFVASLEAGPGTLVLRGEPGIGKTTLWQAGVEAARARSFLVLAARPAEVETKLSFTALGDLLDPVLDEVLPLVLAPQRRALEIALLLAETDGPPPDQRAVRALAKTGPLALAIDDVQWLDSASEGILRFLARRLREEPVGLLLAQRVVAPALAPLDLNRTLPGKRVESVDVGPLTVGALHRLLHGQLGAAFPRPVLLRLHELSGGNPLYALEVWRALKRRTAPLRPGEPLPVPRSLDELIRARVASLPRETQVMLLAAAALSQPTIALIEAATSADVGVRLGAALDAQVVELEGDQIRFCHPLLAASVYESADEAERRAMHAALAAVVVDIEERARRLALSAQAADPAVAGELDRAALHASRRGAPAVVAELFELAARLTPSEDAEQKRRRLVDAAEQHHPAGQLARTRAILAPLVDELPPGRERGRALFQLAWTDQSWERGHALCERALATAVGDALLCGAIHHWLGFVWIVRGDLARATRHADEAVALAERTAEPVALVRALSLGLLVDTLAGQVRQRSPARARSHSRTRLRVHRSTIRPAWCALCASCTATGSTRRAKATSGRFGSWPSGATRRCCAPSLSTWLSSNAGRDGGIAARTPTRSRLGHVELDTAALTLTISAPWNAVQSGNAAAAGNCSSGGAAQSLPGSRLVLLVALQWLRHSRPAVGARRDPRSLLRTPPIGFHALCDIGSAEPVNALISR